MRVEFTRNKGDRRKAGHADETRPFGSLRGGTVSRTIRHAAADTTAVGDEVTRAAPTARG